MNMKSSIKIALSFVVLLTGSSVFAQGEQLFKQKCSVCHMIDKNSTGPALKGVMQKWEDAGEKDNFYKWVQNSLELIASGKSEMANKAKDISPMAMPLQPLTTAEIDQIFEYIDTYTPPQAAPVDAGKPAVIVASKSLLLNYEHNLSLFYALIVTLLIELFVIVYIAKSIMKFKNSDFLKKSETSDGGTGNILSVILLIIATLFASSTFALTTSIPGGIQDDSMWLYVEKSDLYWFILIDLVLLLVILLLRKIARKYFRLASKSKKNYATQSLDKMFDIVPIEQEERIMLHHEYDGIRELDNNLPPWWVWGFVVTIVFSVVYLLNYHVFGTGELQIQEYENSIKKADAQVKDYLTKNALNIDETNATKLTDAAAIKEGESIFQANCVVCHNSKGEGNIGPNLTDKNWIYGFDVKDLFGVIKKGTSNGMPEHGSKLNPVQIQKVASFILQLPDTEGKAPQGDKIE